MSKILVLGAGMVARPLVRYLLGQGYELTLADLYPEKAEALIDGHPRGTAVAWSADDPHRLDELAAAHDLLVSLLPATMHVIAARASLKHGKPMVTTSYVSPEMQALDGEARQAGVLLLNELGVDPGLDHMSAMKIIHQVQRQGGKVSSFRSYCGGLPAPDANDNPWGYKFSWSPLAVLRASANPARYLKNGKEIRIPADLLFLDTHPLDVGGEVGVLEAYPNRDALPYMDLYGLQDIHTMFRGTLRYPGWCETLRQVGALGILGSEVREDWGETTMAGLLAQLLGCCGGAGIKQQTANALWLPEDSAVLDRLAWLGFFDEVKVPLKRGSVMEQLAEAMQQKMIYKEDQRDMLVMHHEFVAEHDSGPRRITSTMVDFGIPGGDSSMARIVSLPAAIAVRQILEGKFQDCGVKIPVTPNIYEPILQELDALGIRLVERTESL